MAEVHLGKVSMKVDASETRAIYRSIDKGGAEKCGCAYCRNFLAQIPDCFPREVNEFFESCGIDPFKDAEVYEMGAAEDGKNLYGGEYYFICDDPPAVYADELTNGFEFTIALPSPLTQEEFRNIKGVRCLSFVFPLAWVLKESP